jgi:hypothetical protein
MLPVERRIHEVSFCMYPRKEGSGKQLLPAFALSE